MEKNFLVWDNLSKLCNIMIRKDLDKNNYNILDLKYGNNYINIIIKFLNQNSIKTRNQMYDVIYAIIYRLDNQKLQQLNNI